VKVCDQSIVMDQQAGTLSQKPQVQVPSATRPYLHHAGRILNVTVCPADTNEPPRLLNYMTAPNVRVCGCAGVLVATVNARECSCALPYVMTPPCPAGPSSSDSPHPMHPPFACRCWCGLALLPPRPSPASTRLSSWSGATARARYAGGARTGCDPPPPSACLLLAAAAWCESW